MPAKKMNLDFSKVKDGGNFNKKRIPSGDYLATITKVEDSPAKGDGSDMLLFSIKIDKHPSSVLPYYCKIQENQLWKLRNIFIAAGMSIPKRKMAVDPNKVVGKKIGVTIEDTYYDEKDQEQSEVGGVFPASELDDAPSVTADDEVDLDGDDEAEEDTSLDIDDEAEAEEEPEAEEEEEAEEEAEPREGLDRTALKRAIKALDDAAKFKASESDDDLYARLVVLRGADAEDEEEAEEEEEAPAPVKKRPAAKAAPAKKPAAKKKPADEVSEEDLEDIDIDDI